MNINDFKKLTDALNAEQLKMLTDKLKEFAISDQNQEMLDKINGIIKKLKLKETSKQKFIKQALKTTGLAPWMEFF